MAFGSGNGVSVRSCAALGLVILLTGCTMAPLGPATRPAGPITPAPVTPAAPIPGDMTPDATASGAEQACIAAGRERGLNVLGVVGSRAVSGSNGENARDVMLRVERSGSELEVRCNYVEDTRMARIMLI